jgi:murein DD-endopeptidase MepM/ murein hydrolase activator NlpD
MYSPALRSITRPVKTTQTDRQFRDDSTRNLQEGGKMQKKRFTAAFISILFLIGGCASGKNTNETIAEMPGQYRLADIQGAQTVQSITAEDIKQLLADGYIAELNVQDDRTAEMTIGEQTVKFTWDEKNFYEDGGRKKRVAYAFENDVLTMSTAVADGSEETSASMTFHKEQPEDPSASAEGAENASGGAKDSEIPAFASPVANPEVIAGYDSKNKHYGEEIRYVRASDENNAGACVTPVAEGTVVKTGTDETYGEYIIIDHGERYYSFYGHMGSVDVSKGDFIESRTPLGDLDAASGTVFLSLRRISGDPEDIFQHMTEEVEGDDVITLFRETR